MRASKAALETMIACYADETEKTPIRVNLFDPGGTRTEMRFKAMPGEDQSKLPSPEDVGETIPFYLAPACALHGERIDVSRACQAAVFGPRAPPSAVFDSGTSPCSP